MVPRAVGLGAGQITFVVVTSLATTLGVGAVTAFTVAFTLLQIPIGVIGVPLGVVLMPTLSRGSRPGGRPSTWASCAGAPGHRLRDDPDRRRSATILRTEVVDAPVRPRHSTRRPSR